MSHWELMGAGHSGFMVLLWVLLLGAVFALGYLTGLAKGRGQRRRDE